MEKTLTEAVALCFQTETYHVVISNPADKKEAYKKIECNYLDGYYQFAKYTDTQVFHENLSYEEAKTMIESMMGSRYKNLNAWTAGREYSIQVSKKGKILFRAKDNQPGGVPKAQQTHNREKQYLLPQGTCIAPLVDMGVFTKDGKVVQAMYDKYKQINHFIEIIDDAVSKSPKQEFTILDFGCGKSYLTFILYYYFTEIKKLRVHMIGLDLKKEVIEKCNLAAQKYGYHNLRFQVGDISDYTYKDKVDMVITLHACDTATDFALFNAISWNADMIFSVPCCQHEINGQIESREFALLLRYGIVKERFSSLLTDAIRCNLLEYCGYKTQMVEFVAFDHTPKNIMIRAVKKQGGDKKAKLKEVKSLLEEFHLNPTLYRLLQDAGRI